TVLLLFFQSSNRYCVLPSFPTRRSSDLIPSGFEGTNPNRAGEGCPRGKSRACSPILADRSGHSRTATSIRLGKQSDRSACRGSSQCVSGDERFFSTKSQIYEGLCQGLAGRGLCAAG